MAFTVVAGMGTLPRSFKNTEALGFFWYSTSSRFSGITSMTWADSMPSTREMVWDNSP